MKSWWVNINKHRILANLKHGRRDSPIRFAHGKHGKASYCDELVIFDKNGELAAIVRTSYDRPILPCGARVAIEAPYGVGPASGFEEEVKCVNAHDRCYEGGPCPYCEPE